MSIERATPSEITTPEKTAADRSEERRQFILSKGGVYGRHGQATTEPEKPTNSCLTCDREIPRDVARTIGDNDGNVGACNRCLIAPNGESYKGIAKAVRMYRADYGQFRAEFGGVD